MGGSLAIAASQYGKIHAAVACYGLPQFEICPVSEVHAAQNPTSNMTAVNMIYTIVKCQTAVFCYALQAAVHESIACYLIQYVYLQCQLFSMPCISSAKVANNMALCLQQSCASCLHKFTNLSGSLAR